MNQFDITYYHGPQAEFIVRPEIVADIAASGMTLVPVGYDTETNKKALSLLNLYGLRAIVKDPRITAIYKNDDMSFESLHMLYLIHVQIVEKEIQTANCEAVVRKHLERAYECAEKATKVKAHQLTHPLLFGWEVQDAPSNNLRILKRFQSELERDYLCAYRDREWLQNLQEKCKEYLKQ